VFREHQLEVRSRQMYEEDCEKLKVLTGSETHVNGLKAICGLSGLQYNHPSETDTCDVMHDLLEGVAPYEVNLLLKTLILTRKYFSLKDFNRMLTCFNYGSIMQSSKPTEISLSRLQNSNGLGQHSHQMLVLLYILPLILAKYVEENDDHWHLFVKLLQIVDIVMTPMFTTGHVSYLTELIADHHKLFQLLYPESHLKYKHHRMVHYPTVMLRNGPLSHMWVMRYEAKHAFFKKLASIVCNFRNISKTFATRHQLHQAFTWINP
jgi:hypothetical protein